jgi:putative tricarboxylic transport membrane protein
VTSPLSLGLLLVGAVALTIAVLPSIRRSRDEIFVED